MPHLLKNVSHLKSKLCVRSRKVPGVRRSWPADENCIGGRHECHGNDIWPALGFQLVWIDSSKETCNSTERSKTAEKRDSELSPCSSGSESGAESYDTQRNSLNFCRRRSASSRPISIAPAAREPAGTASSTSVVTSAGVLQSIEARVRCPRFPGFPSLIMPAMAMLAPKAISSPKGTSSNAANPTRRVSSSVKLASSISAPKWSGIKNDQASNRELRSNWAPPNAAGISSSNPVLCVRRPGLSNAFTAAMSAANELSSGSACETS